MPSKYKYLGPANKLLQVKLPEDMHKDLHALADANGVAATTIIRKLIQDELERAYEIPRKIVEDITNHKA